MIYKLLLGAVIVIGFAYIGFQIEKYYKIRLAVAEDYLSFVAYVERETEFMRTGLCELMRNYGARTEQLKNSLTKCADGLESNNKAVFECKTLPKEAVNDICVFINELARSDFEARRNILKSAYAAALGLKETATADKSKRGELAGKLLILLGVGLLIIIL